MKILVGLMSIVILVHLTSSDLSAIVATYSAACQLILKYNASEVLNTTSGCTDTAIQNGIEANVKIGFCTENEYGNISNTVCGWPAKDYTSSAAKINFYATLNAVSSSCQLRTHECIYSSVVTIVAKQQERYCPLMNLEINGATSELCLTNGVSKCTLEEFQQLKTAACGVNTTATDQVFSTALLSATTTCHSKIAQCADTSPEAWAFVWSEKYCDALNMGGDTPTEVCFKGENACTALEFSTMKVAACGPETTTASVNQTVTTDSHSAITTSGSVMVIFLESLLFKLSQ